MTDSLKVCSYIDAHSSIPCLCIYININIEDVHIYIGGKSKLSSQNAIQNPQLQISFAFGTNL